MSYPFVYLIKFSQRQIKHIRERKVLHLRKAIVFMARTRKLLNIFSAPRQTFFMTLALFDNTYRKIKLHLHYKKHSLTLHHLEGQDYIYISLGFSSISAVLMFKVYCGPQYAVLDLNPSGSICYFNSHP